MREIRETTVFRLDLKRIRMRGKDLDKLFAIVESLAKDECRPRTATIWKEAIGKAIENATSNPIGS